MIDLARLPASALLDIDWKSLAYVIWILAIAFLGSLKFLMPVAAGFGLQRLDRRRRRSFGLLSVLAIFIVAVAAFALAGLANYSSGRANGLGVAAFAFTAIVLAVLLAAGYGVGSASSKFRGTP